MNIINKLLNIKINIFPFNNFYLFPIGDTGSETHVSQDQLSSGEICYLLNQGNNGIDYWFQTLGVDTYPVLDESHGEVAYHNSEYYNKKYSYSLIEKNHCGNINIYSYYK